jgi:hypothetical protein
MKSKILFCLLLLSMLAGTAMAQKLVNSGRAAVAFEPPIKEVLSPTSVVDTLFGPAFSEDCGNAVTALTSSNWGFITGTNGYEDAEKAQRITLGAGNFTVQEVWGFFASASAVGNGTLRAKIYASTPTGPGALLATSTDINVSDIQTDTAAIVPTSFFFPSLPTITGPDVFVSIDFADLYGTQDTAGLWMTNPDCGDGDDAYELWGDGSGWFSFDDPNSWGIETNLLIGLLVESDAVSTQAPLSMNGLQLLAAAPNPATEDIRLNYYLADATEVQIQLYAADGHVVQSINKGFQASGSFVETVQTHNLPTGTYGYSITTQKARLTSKFVVQH